MTGFLPVALLCLHFPWGIDVNSTKRSEKHAVNTLKLRTSSTRSRREPVWQQRWTGRPSAPHFQYCTEQVVTALRKSTTEEVGTSLQQSSTTEQVRTPLQQSLTTEQVRTPLQQSLTTEQVWTPLQQSLTNEQVRMSFQQSATTEQVRTSLQQ